MKLILPRISESAIREIVKPFTDDYGRTYAASRYIRVAQKQREEDEAILNQDYISKEEHKKVVGEIINQFEKHPDMYTVLALKQRYLGGK